jgi:hypothetical protein
MWESYTARMAYGRVSGEEVGCSIEDGIRSKRLNVQRLSDLSTMAFLIDAQNIRVGLEKNQVVCCTRHLEVGV